MSSHVTYATTLQKQHHTRHLAIALDSDGWRLVETLDDAVVREVVLTDWHRVERLRRSLSIEVSALRAEGWLDRA